MSHKKIATPIPSSDRILRSRGDKTPRVEKTLNVEKEIGREREETTNLGEEEEVEMNTGGGTLGGGSGAGTSGDTNPGGTQPPINLPPRNQPSGNQQPQIDPMMLPRGLPIEVPQMPANAKPMPPNLPRFSGSRNEDPTVHIERFEELLISSLVTEPEYYLIWFPTTLTGTAYAWYRSHPARTFTTWNQLQAAFLRQFRPETGQQQALVALTSIRQGPSEDISSYVRRFRVVCTRYVGTLLNEDTIKYYFLQGFDRNSTRREVLTRRPITLEDAIRAALDVDMIDKENDRMEKRTNEPIPSFIPIDFQTTEPLLQHQNADVYRSGAGVMHMHQPTPLAIREPIPLLTSGLSEQVRNEIKSATDGLKEEFLRGLRSLNEQVASLSRGQKSVPTYHESGPHTSGLWCTNQGCINPSGHTSQFCPMLLQQGQQMGEQTQYQQRRGQFQSPGHAQPYQPPHQRNQGKPNDNPNGKSQHPVHDVCGKRHPPTECWIENKVVCGNCGGTHPTQYCRKPDKVIPLNVPPANYARQAQDNMRGARDPIQSTSGPPNLYYDHQNHRQTHNSPTALQTNQGVIQMQNNQSSQDVRMLNDQTAAPVIEHCSNMIIMSVLEKEEASREVPSMVVTRKGLRTGEDLAIDNEREEEKDDDGTSSESSEESLQLPDLMEATKDAAREVHFERDPSLDVEPDEEEYQTIAPRPPTPGPRIKSNKTSNPAEPYDLWNDLAGAKANISFGQLIQLAPSLRKQMREGATIQRRLRGVSKVHHLHEEEEIDPMVNGEEDYDFIEIEVEICDKQIPHTIVDDGSNCNVMPWSTMNKLGLSITDPSFSTIRTADQGVCKPLGKINNLRVRSAGVDYILNFEVVPMKEEKGSYPLLLGRSFLRKCGGIADWQAKKPTFTYGPKMNRTTVLIEPRFIVFGKQRKPIMPCKPQLPAHETNHESLSIESKEDFGPIKCIGPGLYDYVDTDGTFAEWLAENPYSEDEKTVRFMEFLDEEEDSIGLVPLVDDISEYDAFHFEIDGTQPERWEDIMNEEVLMKDLPPPLHFYRTSDGIKVGSDLPIYPPVPNDWYHGPTDPVHVRPSDWKKIDLGIPGDEPREIKVGSQLTNEEVHLYRLLILEFIDVFAWSYTDLKGIPPYVAQHTIPLIPDAKPIRQKERRLNPRMQLIVKTELEKLLAAGFIRPVEITDWVSPMVLVKKKNGQLRVCIDYRLLNKQTQKDHFPLPFVNTILDEVSGHELYTFMDGFSGYNQISIAPEDFHKTAFTTPWGTFIYVVMPFGLCNAPAAFQRAMTFAFSDLLHKSMTVFIDDFSTHSRVSEHISWVTECLIRCRRTGIALNPRKLYLAVKRGVLLGHIVSEAGKEPDPEKVEVIANLKPPTNVKGVQRVLGHIGWYRDRIEDYATAAIPLTNLTKKNVNFEWTTHCQESFDELKRRVTAYPVMRPPDWNCPFHLYCDASAVAVGVALCQPANDGGSDHPIAFASRQLSAAERNYTTTERECLAMIFALKKFRHYLLMNKVVFFVDHMAIRYLVNKPELSGRLARWVLLLSEFDYTVHYKPGRMHRQADHLSRLSMEQSPDNINDEFPDASLFAVKKVPSWYAHIAEFLSTHQFPEGMDKNERRKIRVNSTHFVLISGKLYRKGIDGVLRRCVDYTEVPSILEACHDSACGGHFSGRLTAQKVLRAGYFWPTLFADAEAHTKNCDACQRYARNDLHMDLPLHPSLPLVPLEKWGIDYVGPITPTSSRRNQYIIVATEYLTKWAEAKAVKSADAKQTAIFLYENVIARFGCPKVLISDRGAHFLNEAIEEMTKLLQINHRKTTPYHPQTNGMTERVNQTLFRILRKIVADNKRDWDVKLTAALWAYRTTYKVTTRATPFALMYGIEAILPIELEVQSLRIAMDERLNDSQSLKDRLEHLEALSEARRLAAQHVEVIQRRRKVTFDKKHKVRTLQPGMWVLVQDARKIEFPGKFDAVWMGPYVVKEVFPNNSLQLKTLDGLDFPTRTNGSRCKEYKV